MSVLYRGPCLSFLGFNKPCDTYLLPMCVCVCVILNIEEKL